MLVLAGIAGTTAMPGPAAAATCAPVKFQLVNAGAGPLRIERIELRGVRGEWTLNMKGRELGGGAVYTTNKLAIDGVESGEGVRVRVRFRRADGGSSVRTSEAVDAVCERNVTVRLTLD